MIKRILSLAVLAVLALGACKKETRPLTQIEDESITAYLKKNNLTGFIKDSTGFYYKIVNQGTGIKLKGCPGDDYVGVFQTTTSVNKSVNFEFSKYSPQYNFLCYIKPDSWRQSLSLLNKGGEVRIITPSYLAYGKTGSGSSIPGNAILDTKLSVVDDADRPAYEDALIQSYLAEQKITATKDANGIYYTIITAGTGTKITSENSTVKTAYELRFLGRPLYQKATEASPFSTVLSGTIQGWIKALPLIAKGGQIRLFIPSRFGYGTGGTPDGSIPGNTILDFDIKLLDVTN